MAAATTGLPSGLQQVQAAFTKSSVVVKAICISTTLVYLLSFLINTESILSGLAVTPGLIFPPSFRIWTLVTHAFVEVHFWFVVIGVSVTVLCGRIVEPLWGALEMLIFFAVSTVGSAILSSMIYLFMYMTSFNVDYLFDTHFYGLPGYCAGVFVALKQLCGDQELSRGAVKLRIGDLPLVILVAVLLLRIIGIVAGTYLCMTGSGILVSWVYLRFYQRQSDGKEKGDMSDSFTFASFFPEVIRPPIAILANTVHSFLVRIKVCKKQVRKYDVGAPSPITITLPGTDPADAERRRQIALKALNERLSKVEEQTAWPSMEDQPSSPDSEHPSLSASLHGDGDETRETDRLEMLDETDESNIQESS
ncbi:transmembrane protein 115-like [Amphiura filiformis]|uniref:transmembrane protein 115-like n=1 Tax=Amphiura filiformis TaxID=82378 RepID=UPI003B21D0E2